MLRVVHHQRIGRQTSGSRVGNGQLWVFEAQSQQIVQLGDDFLEISEFG